MGTVNVQKFFELVALPACVLVFKFVLEREVPSIVRDLEVPKLSKDLLILIEDLNIDLLLLHVNILSHTQLRKVFCILTHFDIGKSLIIALDFCRDKPVRVDLATKTAETDLC